MFCDKCKSVMFRDTYRVGVIYYCPKCLVEDEQRPQTEQAEASSLSDGLAAPCILCNYNGEGYWQAGTHKKECPWHGVGGKAEREAELPKKIRFAVQYTYGC